MYLCTFTRTGQPLGTARAGVVRDSQVHALDTRLGVIEVIEAAQEGDVPGTTGRGYSLEEVVLHAPIPRPGKIIATIVNTKGMLGGKDLSLDRPRLDMKAPSAVVGPGAEILGPKEGIRPEVELAAIVGKRMLGVSRDQADAALFGYTVLNDVTAPSDAREDAYEAYRRDKTTGEIKKAVLRGPLFRSKNHDTFCPMGPWIVTRDQEPDWSNLRMTTKFDDLIVQEGSTSEYIFGPAEIASYVSRFLTLEPGDVVSCGSIGWTPQALGKLDPTEYVLPRRKGTLELGIEGIGKLRNPVSLTG
jgi:2-keto-4-pentenoate hydratase/2-oxohepta-3-ene-1,7-dioic acid hydratase in catechol pathway